MYYPKFISFDALPACDRYGYAAYSPILKLHSGITKGIGVPYPKEYRQVPNHQPRLNATKTPVSNLHTVKIFVKTYFNCMIEVTIIQNTIIFLHLCDTGNST